MAKEKGRIKTWFKKNWPYVIGALSLVAAGVAVGTQKSGPTDVIDPFVIDRGKDDWMDILKVPFNETKVTVRQATNLADYYSKMADFIFDHEGIDIDLAANFDYNYSTDFPGKYENIELALV